MRFRKKNSHELSQLINCRKPFDRIVFVRPRKDLFLLRVCFAKREIKKKAMSGDVEATNWFRLSSSTFLAHAFSFIDLRFDSLTENWLKLPNNARSLKAES